MSGIPDSQKLESAQSVNLPIGIEKEFIKGKDYLKCTRCKQLFPINMFNKDSSRKKRKHDYYCLKCKNDKLIKYRKNNPNKHVEQRKKQQPQRNKRAREKYAENSTSICEYRRKIYQKLKEENPKKLKQRAREHHIRYRQNSPEKYSFSYYKRNAKNRKIPFEITFDEFMLYWQQPCSYCGEKIITIGLDRIDNSTGYCAGNIIPCCHICNVMKNNHTINEFINRCKNIVKTNYIPPPDPKRKVMK